MSIGVESLSLLVGVAYAVTQTRSWRNLVIVRFMDRAGTILELDQKG